MTITINGTTGISGVDGSAATPAFKGNDSNTGVSFGTDIVTINTGGQARVTTDASGNVGIGTESPSTKLQVKQTTNSSTGGISLLSVDGTSASVISELNNGSMTFRNTGADRMTLDTSGNLGLGVTPSAWNASYKPIEIGRVGNAIMGGVSGSSMEMMTNVFLNTSGSYRYANNGAATNYYQNAGNHYWYIAPSGTAGNAISFTQAMALDVNGKLFLGSVFSNISQPAITLGATYGLEWNWTSGASYANIFNQASSAALVLADGYQRGTGLIYKSSVGIEWAKSAISVEYGTIRFMTDAPATVAIGTDITPSERMRLNTDGNLSVGTTASGARFRVDSAGNTNATQAIQINNSSVVEMFRIRNDGAIFTGTSSSGLAACPYNNTTANAANMVVGTGGDLQRSTSSLRYKTNVNDATHGLADVMALRSVTYKGKNDGETVFGGLIAEEVDAAGLNEFVVYDAEGKPDALHYGNMVSLAFKAIQEQQAIITQLQADVAALKGAA